MMIKQAMTAAVVATVLAFASSGAGAFSSGSSSSSTTTTTESSYALGKKAADAGDYQTAIGYFSKAVQADPGDADSYNMLGFSYRKLGKVEAAFESYQTALRINSKHKGANEYIGELFLETGNLAEAEKHLHTLGNSCAYSCVEYKELKAAVATYKAKSNG